MNVRSTRQCIDKPQQKYVPLSDRKSAQIHTGKEVNDTIRDRWSTRRQGLRPAARPPQEDQSYSTGGSTCHTTTASHHAAATQQGFSNIENTDKSTESKISATIALSPGKTMKKSDKENRCNNRQKNFDSRCRTTIEIQRPSATNCEYAASDIAEPYTEIGQRSIAEETEIRSQKNSVVAISPEVAENSVRIQRSDVVPKLNKSRAIAGRTARCRCKFR